MNNKKTKLKFKIIEENDENFKDEKLKKNKENEELLNEYLNSLDPMEITAMDIAKISLGSSFDIEKSIGFLDFKKTKNKTN